MTFTIDESILAWWPAAAVTLYAAVGLLVARYWHRSWVRSDAYRHTPIHIRNSVDDSALISLVVATPLWPALVLLWALMWFVKGGSR